MKVRDLRRGGRAIVTGYAPGEAADRARLLALGVTRGIALTVLNIAPLGDPVEVRVRGYALSLRKAEADVLEIEAVR